MTNTLMRRGLLALTVVGLSCPAWAQTPPKLQTFPTPEAAADALTAALRKDDERAMDQMLGASWRDFVPGTRHDEDGQRATFLAAWDEQHKIQMSTPDKALVQVGKNDFVMPIPIVKEGDTWRFDVDAGRVEIRARLIGRNEYGVIQSLLALVDAQREYAERDPMRTGVAVYARRIFSTPGLKDGLYWETKEGEPQSPLGPLLAKSQPGTVQGDGYYGYNFRLLYGQGASAPGGAYSYLVNNRMIGGFAAIARPTRYGETGVMTFIVSFNGEVYEKDLGPDTAVIAGNMALYDPDKTWEKADMTPP